MIYRWLKTLGKASSRATPYRSPRAQAFAQQIKNPKSEEFFDARWYLARYADVRNKGIDPFQHYVEIGRHERRHAYCPYISEETIDMLSAQYDVIKRSGIFDARWYAGRYGVEESDALDHFVYEGGFSGNDPNPFFSTLSYYDENPDVLEHGLNSLGHYITYGIFENRSGVLPARLDLDETAWREGRI